MATVSSKDISVILPARNEANSLSVLLPKIREVLPDCELVVINDGSEDDTQGVADQHADQVIRHPHSMGNGAAIKAGARAATREIFLFMDADGQHKPEDIPVLLESYVTKDVMVIGARHPSTHANIMRRFANTIYNMIASYMTGQKIMDLTSGFRIVKAETFKNFLYMLPNGFSYPTTITMALSRTGTPIIYCPISALKREGKSHIQPITDGIRFLLIIFKISALYSPLKIFAPAAFLCFSAGSSYYLYTYLTDGRFTNMGVLLFTTSLLIFMIGLVSEQITTLMYSQAPDNQFYIPPN